LRTSRFDVAAPSVSPYGRSVGVIRSFSGVATPEIRKYAFAPAVAAGVKALTGRAAAMGAGALAGSKATKPLFMREGAEEAGDSAFERLKEANQKRQEMEQRSAADKQGMSDRSRSATNPASTNTTQFS
jgi:hypothetical protein